MPTFWAHQTGLEVMRLQVRDRHPAHITSHSCPGLRCLITYMAGAFMSLKKHSPLAHSKETAAVIAGACQRPPSPFEASTFRICRSWCVRNADSEPDTIDRRRRTVALDTPAGSSHGPPAATRRTRRPGPCAGPW
jgi:hypothetical protein